MIDDVSCIAHALGYRLVTDINRIFSFFRETGLIADLAEFLPLGSSTTTKRITDTPQQERDLSFSPDGRALVYAAERNGVWQIYQSKIKNEKEKNFTYATDIEEEQLVKTGITSQYPQYSPDGKEVAFFEDRAALRIVNLKSKKIRTVLDGKYVYSYSDGDIAFEWSPDSKWLLSTYIGNGGWRMVLTLMMVITFR